MFSRAESAPVKHISSHSANLVSHPSEHVDPAQRPERRSLRRASLVMTDLGGPLHAAVVPENLFARLPGRAA